MRQAHPARFVSAFVDELGAGGWSELGISLEGEPLGAPAYDPQVLLRGMAVWVHGWDKVVAEAGRGVSRPDTLPVADGDAMARPQYAMEVLPRAPG